jgi:hypothetical protein
MADSQTYSSADLHSSAHVYPVADAHAYPCADLHPVSDVYAGSDIHPLPDTEGRADLHALSDLYTMAYVDTDTCAYCHGNTYSDTDCDPANTNAGSDSYSGTNTYADRHPFDTDTGANCYGSPHAYAHADAYASTDGYAGPHLYANARPNRHTYADSHAHITYCLFVTSGRGYLRDELRWYVTNESD